MALGVNRLERRGGEVGPGGDPLQHSADPLHARIGAVDVGHTPLADDVVDHDHGAGPGERQGALDVVARALLVGVDEDEVEGELTPGDRRVEPIERRPRDNLDGVAEAGVRERPPGEVGPAGIEFERHDPPTGREAAREPNSA